MAKDLMTIFLMAGFLGVSVSHYQWRKRAEKCQVEIVEVVAKNKALKFLLDNCVDDRAEKLVEAREENFIPSPGRFYAQEIDLHDLINEFFSGNDEQRVCFGREWARPEKELG